MKQHLAIYGNVLMARAHCWKCKRFSLVVDGEIQCCGRQIETNPEEVLQISQPESRRRRLSAVHRREILQTQNYKCLYCGISLIDSYAFYHGQVRKVRVNWDHMAPYTYTLNNHKENYAATCQFCNSWKSSLIFKTVDEVRAYVEAKWQGEGKGAKDLCRSEVSNKVRAAPLLAKVLQPAVPVSGMVEITPAPEIRERKRRIVMIKTWHARE